MTGHDDVRILLGAYVLGGLDDGSRNCLEQHLQACTQCRDELAAYAPIPALLRRADAIDVPTLQDRPALAARLLDQVRAERRRRHRRTVVQSAIAAFAVAAVVLVGTVLVRSETGHASGTALQAAAGSRVAGQASYTAKPWGTAISLDIQHLPATGHFILVAVGRHGERDQAASWGATPSRQAHLAGATSIPLAELAEVLVLAEPSGSTLATAPA